MMRQIDYLDRQFELILKESELENCPKCNSKIKLVDTRWFNDTEDKQKFCECGIVCSCGQKIMTFKESFHIHGVSDFLNYMYYNLEK